MSGPNFTQPPQRVLPDALYERRPGGKGTEGDQREPVQPAEPVPGGPECDAAFVLRLFGVEPSGFIRDNHLDREGLAASVTAHRGLYASRVQRG